MPICLERIVEREKGKRREGGEREREREREREKMSIDPKGGDARQR
jgi:hypothetical protein